MSIDRLDAGLFLDLKNKIEIDFSCAIKEEAFVQAENSGNTENIKISDFKFTKIHSFHIYKSVGLFFQHRKETASGDETAHFSDLKSLNFLDDLSFRQELIKFVFSEEKHERRIE